MTTPDLYDRILKREKQARYRSEQLLEEKTRDLFIANESLKKQNELIEMQAKKTELFLKISEAREKWSSEKDFYQYFIDAICEMSDWPLGHILIPDYDHPDELISSGIWHIQNHKYNDFKKVSSAIKFTTSMSLPGMVFGQGKSIWIEDISSEHNFIRSMAAKKIGINGAFAVPIIVNEKTTAVAEFFYPEIAGKDSYLLHVTEAAAKQLSLNIERLHTETALRLRNRAIESCVNAIIIINNKIEGGPVEYMNPAFEKITGYSEKETIGKNFRSLLFQRTNASTLEIIDDAIINNKECHVVLENYKKNNTQIWSDLYLAPVPDNNNDVTHFVGILNDITENVKFRQQLEIQASHDALTGLFNRTILYDRLTMAIAQAKRSHKKIAIIFLDLDHFKLINDSLGHDTGDMFLKKITVKLKNSIRSSDTLGRLGGDEFVLIMPDQKDVKVISIFLQRILKVISDPCSVEGMEINTTCSIGISVYPDDGEDAQTLLKNADAAMYRAKEQGRNNFQFFTHEMHTKIKERLSLESSLHRALEREEFFLCYQPLVDIKINKIVGVEALIRWQHPERGLILPMDFIPIAEEAGLIIPIGEWVLKKSCTQNKHWQEMGHPHIAVSVNLSTRQFKLHDIVKTVNKILTETRLDPKYLELEITESMLMHDTESMINILLELKNIGVLIAIDDFGTGYSSLNYLRQLPVTSLKIDKSFIESIGNKGETIVKAIIALGHSLGVKIVAEGVENKEQLQFLREHDCDEIQGYLFCRPLPAAEIEKILAVQPKV